MINGIYENLALSWQERIGEGCEAREGESLENIVHTKDETPSGFEARKWKDGTLQRIEHYIIATDGSLARLTYNDPEGNLLWDYQFQKDEDSLNIIMTTDEGETRYQVSITERDADGRIMNADQVTEGGEVFGKVYAERADDGTLLREFNELYGGMALQITSCDADGRFTYRENHMGDTSKFERFYH